MEFLHREIIKTLKFYKIFSFSLTPLEIYKNLGVKTDFYKVLNVLKKLIKLGEIQQKSGYFFLTGSNSLYDERNARFLLSIKKMKRAHKIAKIFSHFPFIRFIGVCNSLGFFNAKDSSDIDFFIITKAKNIWTTRFLTVSFLKLFNMRPEVGNEKDKICLSFFITEDALDISSVSLSGGDPYFYYWLSWIMPLYDDGIYKDFRAKNNWVKKYLPNLTWQKGNIKQTRFLFKEFFENIFEGSEKFFRWIQLRIMPKELLEARNRDDNSVVMNDNMLKFHLLDRRAEYKEKFLK